MSDPEETAPFTHTPYGKKEEDNPFVSPSGSSAQPSGPDFVTPQSPPPPTVPYGGPDPGAWLGYPPGGFAPVYGPMYAGAQKHPGATTALTLGIISIASFVLGFSCCFITLPGVFCAPFAWYVGAKAGREIERQPGVYGNLGNAKTGMWMGIVMTFVGALALVGVAVLFVWIGVSDPSLV